MKRREFLGTVLGAPLLCMVPARAAFGAAASAGLRRIAFGSCALQDRPQPVWDAILATHPDIFVFLGDNIYADTTDMTVMRARYEQLAAIPSFRRFRERVPIRATWDDHDYGANDSGREYPKKVQSKQLFLDFFKDPADSPRRSREGVYEAYMFGEHPRRVQLILLDLRWFRDPLHVAPDGAYLPSPVPGASMLGPQQWAWLEAQLRVPADVRVLGSSIQLVSSVNRWEKWANFPADKARLYRLIDALRLDNLVVISGDMHFGELSMEETPGGIKVYDLTSSGLNRHESARDIPNPARLALLDTADNFGLVDIDWSASPPRVSLEVRDVSGEVRISRRGALG